jgi:uncharacterized protein YdeI (YjbR/CyaY-like superfamily)
MAKVHPKDGLRIVAFESASSWRNWLVDHHQTSPGLWLKIAKKNSGLRSITYAQAVDEALCFGWIDGQKGSLDEHFFLQRFTRRGPRSQWSRINRQKVADLSDRGLMTPAGQAAVDAARDDGRWAAAYPFQAHAEIPDDLQTELDKNPGAQEFFDSLTISQRYSFLYRIHQAKRPATRTSRIAKTIDMLLRQEKFG